MSMGKLDNCTRCGVLFVKSVRDICPKCYIEVEKEYEKCSQFLRKRENRMATIHQVSEETGVSVKQITRFIKEGRLAIANNPNMGYPCENCGVVIRAGHLCEDCARELKRELEQQTDLEKRLAEEARQRMQKGMGYRRKSAEDE